MRVGMLPSISPLVRVTEERRKTSYSIPAHQIFPKSLCCVGAAPDC